VSRLWRGEQERIATGLPSYGTPNTTGPHDIAFRGGHAYVTLGLGLEGLPRSALGDVGEQQFGWLVRLAASGAWRPVADIAGHEFATNPGAGPVDSNP
jgi:hypothetical protein